LLEWGRSDRGKRGVIQRIERLTAKLESRRIWVVGAVLMVDCGWDDPLESGWADL
jgi:hypothetical protein